jgi:hypothetical protein
MLAKEPRTLNEIKNPSIFLYLWNVSIEMRLKIYEICYVLICKRPTNVALNLQMRAVYL